MPSSLTPNGSGTDHGLRTLAITVYFGAQLLEATDGLPAVYAELFRLDADIQEALMVTAMERSRASGESLQVTYRDTVLDEDRLPHYKLMAARFDGVEW